MGHRNKKTACDGQIFSVTIPTAYLKRGDILRCKRTGNIFIVLNANNDDENFIIEEPPLMDGDELELVEKE